MAEFYGTIQGARGEASRLGGKASGLRTYAASWDGAVVVNLSHVDGGPAHATVELTTHHGAGVRRTVYSGPVNAPATLDAGERASLENARGVLNAADAFGVGCLKPGAALDALRALVAALDKRDA